MLGLGWTEMLVIGVMALIFIGPKDLPVVMNRVGKVLGQIRRMGNDFQREINKTTGLDEVRNLRTSITAPLKKTSEEIRKEFNAMTPGGQQPSGVLKPTDPATESVVEEIRSKAGMSAPVVPQSADEVAKAAGFRPAGPAPTVSKAAPVPATKKPRVSKTPVRAKTPPKSVVSKEAAPAAGPVGSVSAEAAPTNALEPTRPAAKASGAKAAGSAPRASRRAPASPPAASSTPSEPAPAAAPASENTTGAGLSDTGAKSGDAAARRRASKPRAADTNAAKAGGE